METEIKYGLSRREKMTKNQPGMAVPYTSFCTYQRKEKKKRKKEKNEEQSSQRFL
jgi:hypothetical protein